MVHIIKVIRQIEKYELLIKDDHENIEIRDKIKNKIPILEKAVKKLLEKKKTFDFTNIELLKSPDSKNEYTNAFNSTMNLYSEVAVTNRLSLRNESIRTIGGLEQNDSCIGSLTKMLSSAKTDGLSKFTDKQSINEMKLNEYVNDSKLFEEKLAEMQNKFSSLINLNFH